MMGDDVGAIQEMPLHETPKILFYKGAKYG
jgi:hypothetical protein